MGFFLASSRTRLLLNDFTPAITGGEYIAILSKGMRACSKRPHFPWHDFFAVGAVDPSRELGPLIETLTGLVRRHPDDPVVHRMLGIAYSHVGRPNAAVRYLESALALLKRDACDPSSLATAIQVQLDAALIRVALMPIYARLGQRDALRRLASEALGPFRT